MAETEEQKQARLRIEAARMAELRMAETEAQKRAWLDSDAARHTELRMAETEEQKLARLRIVAARIAKLRMSETEAQKQAWLDSDAARHAELRVAETEEQKLARLRITADRSQQRRASTTNTPASPQDSSAFQDSGEIPNIAQFVENDVSLKMAFEHLTKTRIGCHEQVPEIMHDTNFPLLNQYHQANICAVCDEFISGAEKPKWIAKQKLLNHSHRLSQPSLPESLKKCYQVFDEELHHLLLSPPARVTASDEYMCCCQCFVALHDCRKEMVPPKFAIANGWAIGSFLYPAIHGHLD
jgi:hypothetical protein